MSPIRILVVDDSALHRKMLCAALSGDATIEIAGVAADGRIALSKMQQLHPDLITLDIEMAGWNGLETLVEIRKLDPKLPVIMFSSFTEHGAAATLEALACGASDYAAKPANAANSDEAKERIRADLIPKIKALCPQTISAATARPIPRGFPVKVAPRSGPRASVEVLAIGASTGGPNALAALLPTFPADFPVPIVIVQHMPPIFTRLLAERLSKTSKIQVREGETGKTLAPGTAWISPGGDHMIVERQGADVRLEINREARENSCRPSVDVLFRSIAQVYGAHALSVVMTGMGSDGVRGAQQLCEAGGEVIVQDEASSVVWGMPGLVAAAGHSSGVYSLESLGPEIIRRVMSRRSAVEGQAPTFRVRT